MNDTSAAIKAKRGRKRRARIQAKEITGEKHVAGVYKYLGYLRRLYPQECDTVGCDYSTSSTAAW